MAVVKNNSNTVDERCKVCFRTTYANLCIKFNAGVTQRMAFWFFFDKLMHQKNGMSSPEIQRELNNRFCQLLKISDPFAEEKAKSNAIATTLYNEWKLKLNNRKNIFDVLLRLSIAGNIMDYGAGNHFDIHKTINHVLISKFAIDDSLLLKDKIGKAKRILYLGDNAGEILFDKLFIEKYLPKNVTYVVRGGPILNDATMSEALDVGIDKVARVVSSGFDAPSTVIHKSDKNFRKLFKDADLIISKGQGNFEGLFTLKDTRIFFLLMVKCEVIAELLKVNKGDFVVFNSK